MDAGQDDNAPLAHSAPKEGMPGDPYSRHVKAVVAGASSRAEAMLRYCDKPAPGLLGSIESAAFFHDFGKLDPETQKILHKDRRGRLRWDHIDAGVAHLTGKNDWMAAWLVRAHHAPGLPRFTEHFADQGRRLRGRRRDEVGQERHMEQIARTDRLKGEYLRSHEEAVGHYEIEKKKPVYGLTMRLALSSLVDADHSDSAFFDSGRRPPDSLAPRWEERLNALCRYVRSLPAGNTESERIRNQRRREFFEACLNTRVRTPIAACEGPVGLGKTTAVTAYLISRAIEEGLRHLFIIAPYTNILAQTAERLREALILPGEQPDEVIVEHHHRADFSHIDERELAVLWRAPIVLTTAVSFFETLAACNPASLRKLHEVPGSAIFLDEAHAALPTRLWPQNWKWINELAGNWRCRFVLASGSLSRFWEHEGIVDSPVKLPELLPPNQATQVMEEERRRVWFAQAEGGRVMSVDELIGLVRKSPGPRLLILNTVQNAAVVANEMRKARMDALHLSTALTPHDRETVLRRVVRKLKSGMSNDWTLVATSCVEAGVDFSFRCAFRERFSTASIIQVGGRVNRHGEYNDCGGGVAYDFALDDRTKGITQHPAAGISADILRYFMDEDRLNVEKPADSVTRAMREELRICGGALSDPLLKAEREKNYPEVEKLGRVIDSDTRFVVIDPDLKARLKAHLPVNFQTLLRGSVQLWANRIEKLGLIPLQQNSASSNLEIYEWGYEYDPDFLGYMKGVLKIDDFMSAGAAVI